MANQTRNDDNGHRRSGNGDGGSSAASADAREGMRSPRASAGASPARDRGPSAEPAYGDYGHPGEGVRQAYGDMGYGGREGGRERTGAARGARESGDPGPLDEGGGRASRDGGAARGRVHVHGPRELHGARRWRAGAECARDVMTRNPRSVTPTDPIQRVSELMIEEDTGIVPVVDGERRLLGVITDRDIVCRLVARGLDVRGARAQDVMSDQIECVTEQESLHEVLRLMAEHQVRRVPVVARGDRLVGIVAMADIAREADLDEELQETFSEISSGRSFWSRLR
jgi:CBS domain-containing protein